MTTAAVRHRVYRPTTLSLLERTCPRALDFYEADTPTDRRQFETGIAAHAVLQACGELARRLGRSPAFEEMEAEARQTCRGLIEVGRSFDGKPEPPLNPDRVFEGRELALDWLSFNAPSPLALYEIGYALDAKGDGCEYGAPEAKLKHIIDVALLDEQVDEESAARRLVLTDFKTAWPVDESELKTLQRKVQALMGWEFWGPDIDVIRLEVVNLRTQKTYAREVWILDGGDKELARWKRDVYDTLETDERQASLGRRPAVPGYGCTGCPYLMACEDAQDFLESARVPGTPELRATAYAVASAVRNRLADILRDETADAPIAIPGAVVGTVGREERRLVEDAYARMWDEWELGGGDGPGFARAIQPSVANAEQLAKRLFPERADRHDREAFVSGICKPQIRRLFGVHPVSETTANREEA